MILTRCRTNHFGNILADCEFSAGSYLLTVSISGLLFSHGAGINFVNLIFILNQSLALMLTFTYDFSFELDLERVKMNRVAKNLGPKSFTSKVMYYPNTHKQTTDQLLCLATKAVAV